MCRRKGSETSTRGISDIPVSGLSFVPIIIEIALLLCSQFSFTSRNDNGFVAGSLNDVFFAKQLARVITDRDFVESFDDSSIFLHDVDLLLRKPSCTLAVLSSLLILISDHRRCKFYDRDEDRHNLSNT